MFAAVTPRASLDAAVLDTARAAGAKVHDGHGLRGARAAGDLVELDVDGLGPVAAPYVVGADGMWSPLRHALDAFEPGYLGDWHAFRQYFADVAPAAGDLWVWFEADLLPGYAWSFPLPGGRANVGFGIQRGPGTSGKEMKAMWPDLLARPHIQSVLGDRARPEAPHKAWPIPARVDRVPLTAAGGRALFTGDAACATDPLTGEGIAQAFATGRWAAEAIVRAGGASPAATAERYEASVRSELLPDHRMSALLSRALRHRKGARTALRVAGATAWTRRNFARWLFEDYPRAMVGTPRRWHRGMFTAPGAYRD
jgi:flavin-dependent dehydrogenase